MNLAGMLKAIWSALRESGAEAAAVGSSPANPEAGPAPAVGSVYDLRPGRCYSVLRDFSDHYGNRFETGERLTFRGRSFLPYHGGHTLQFEERGIWLQEEDDADILGRFGEFLALAEP